jgi:hypothetical protein
MNCNGQPIDPHVAESIEMMNNYMRANQAYIEAYLGWMQLWMQPWQYYQNIYKGVANDKSS